MDKFAIVSNKDTYSMNEYSIDGDLFITINGFAFPSVGWNDLVISVLHMWIASATKIIVSKRMYKRRFYFMDGQYFYDIKLGKDGNILITLNEHEQQKNKIPYVINPNCFFRMLAETINSIILDSNLCNAPGVSELTKAYRVFENEARIHGYI